jgi:hypothetical protein
MTMKKRFALMAMVCMAVVSIPVGAQVKGLNKEEVGSADQKLVAPDGSGFRISPDGKLLAFFDLYKDVPNVFVVPLNGGDRMQVSFAGDAGVQEFYWLKNHLVAFVTNPGSSGISSLYVGDFQMGEYRKVSADGANVRAVVVSSYDGTLNYEMNSTQAPYTFNYYQYDTETLSSKLIASNSTGTLGWATDFGPKAAFGYDFIDGSVKLSSRDGEKFALFEKCLQFKPVLPSTIHKGMYYCISDNARNGSALVEISLADGSEREVIFHKPGSSVDRVFLSPRDRRPLMVWYRGKENGFQLIDKGYSALMEDIKSKIPGADALQIVDCSHDENVWIVLMEYKDGRMAYYRYNVANKEVRSLNNVEQDAKSNIAKQSVQVTSDTRGKELVIRISMPPIEEFKYPAILLFGEAMWSLNSQSHDKLVESLCLQGYPIIEVDLVHSQSYGAEAMLNGFSWWSGMLVSDLPVIFSVINKKFPTIPGIVPCGMGIGAAVAMRAMSVHPDMKMRSILIQPYFSEGVYASWLAKSKAKELRFITKNGDQPNETVTPYLGAAANPMVIHSTMDMGYVEMLSPVLQSMSVSGNAPAIMNYSDEMGIMESAVNVSQAVHDISAYISAVAIKKIK